MKHNTSKINGVAPATDILEMEDGFHILMDIPGVSQENLKVDLEDNELTITGASAYKIQENNIGRKIHLEFDAAEFNRSFTMSELVDRERVKAELKNGVLRIFLPKAEAMKPRRISIL